MSSSPRLLSLVVCAQLLLTACGEGSYLGRRIFGNKDRDSDTVKACESRGVQKITLPQIHADAASATFPYAFQHIPAASPDLPTIVYIPGGPGQTSIGDHADWLEDMPQGYGLVLTDPRGVGCNYVDAGQVGDAFYTSEHVARDILSAVKHLNLDNYTLYGISYGTVVATIAASIAESDAQAWKQPKGVMLEGVLSRAFTDYAEVSGRYSELWASHLALLSLTAGTEKADQFKREPLPLGFDADTWHGAIRTGLMIGSIYYPEDDFAFEVVPNMIAAAVSDDAEKRARARELVELLTADDGSFTKGSDEFYVNIACEEVFTDLRANDFSGGEFVQSGVNYCAEAGLYGSRRFDAAKYPVKAPIYYLQGADDPATPAALARLHFDGQTASPNRQYLLVNGGGHNPFKMNMSDCYQTVFAAMANQGDFAASLATCGWSEGFALTSIKDGAATTANLDGAALTLTAVDQLFDNAPVTEQLIQPLRGLLISK